ncbi:hypothetical protein [Burkholderia sp. PR2]|uniref:hypothetical protein n=1 Tax=Burkholderia sp. PR2 TaxID=3448078 RepID=UPI00402AE045
MRLHRKFADGCETRARPRRTDRRDADAAERAAHEHTMLFQKRFLDYMKQNMTESMAVL